MLSSGTLNLKFMQRGKAPQTIQSNHSRQRSLGQKSSPGRLKDSYNSKHSDQRQDQAPEIVYEDSLISFPLLSFSSSSSASTKSLRTKNLSNCLTVVPHHVGRRSYGEFNKTVEKLGLLSTDNLKDQKTAKREAELGTSSKPKRTDQSNKATKRSSKPIQSQYDHSSKPLDALTTTNHSIVSTNNGFVKPFSLISILGQLTLQRKGPNSATTAKDLIS
ncbi:hypothetical protein PPACK8108_LOCUS22673 [Phakopsora pachyrhizi]|uniref:Uncharacterized protein n=1 Tax=Phakopsora pachyrhizi TaxID=170000 RepID=A0AAV0BMH0_PHAPC|nr:hypothetical protein PPACK8108_LOCUS22673 [Phakopsora pachyrhizi]